MKKSINKIDIIIVNYNSTDYALKSIESIYESLNGLSANIIVADNASTDSPERLKKEFPKIKLMLNGKNLGFSKAVNKAFKISLANFVLLINPDTIIQNNFFKNLLEFIEKKKTTGIVGPMVYDEDGKIQGSARRFPTILTSIFGRKSPLTRIFPNNPITKREFICFSCSKKEHLEVDWVSGACMAINRSAFESVGGFDEKFFLYWEDTDLCKRIGDQGWNIIYYPEIHVVHSVGKSSSQKPFFSTYHFHKSCFYLLKKHAHWPLRLIVPIGFLGLAIRAIIVFCIHITNGKKKKKTRKIK